MIYRIHIPSLGANMEKAKITKWFAQSGGKVEQGETVASIETDKASYDITAPGNGILKIIRPPGEEVPVGGVIGMIASAGEDFENLKEPVAKAETETPLPSGPAPAVIAEVPGDASSVKISAIARKIAAERGVDLTQVKGTGPGGRITKEDVERVLPQGSPARVEPRATTPGETRIKKVEPLSPKKRAMAKRLQESMQVMAQMTNWEFVDMSRLIDLKKSVDRSPQPGEGGITYNDIFVKFTGLALQEYPLLNSALKEDQIVTYEDINIGVAVAMGDEGDDLVVPVIRRVQEKSIREISQELRALIRKSRGNGLSLDDLTGGTISITNIGAFGANPGTPIIQLPQSAVVGFGAIEKKPVVVEDQTVIRPIMLLAVTVDHRFITGAISARFRKRLKDLLENPTQVILDWKS